MDNFDKFFITSLAAEIGYAHRKDDPQTYRDDLDGKNGAFWHGCAHGVTWLQIIWAVIIFVLFGGFGAVMGYAWWIEYDKISTFLRWLWGILAVGGVLGAVAGIIQFTEAVSALRSKQSRENEPDVLQELHNRCTVEEPKRLLKSSKHVNEDKPKSTKTMRERIGEVIGVGFSLGVLYWLIFM